MADIKNEVNYQPVAGDPAKACATCKNFQPKGEDLGSCFGHDVSSKGVCNFFELKEGGIKS